MKVESSLCFLRPLKEIFAKSRVPKTFLLFSSRTVINACFPAGFGVCEVTVGHGSLFLSCIWPVVPAPSVENTTVSPLTCLSTFVETAPHIPAVFSGPSVSQGPTGLSSGQSTQALVVFLGIGECKPPALPSFS